MIFAGEEHGNEAILQGYFELLQSWPHWMFEITLILIFDVIIGLILWPLIKRAVHRHDEEKHAKCPCINCNRPEGYNPRTALGEYLIEADWLISNAEPRSGSVGFSEWQRRAEAWRSDG